MMLINSLRFAKRSEKSEEVKFGDDVLRTHNLGSKPSKSDCLSIHHQIIYLTFFSGSLHKILT